MPPSPISPADLRERAKSLRTAALVSASLALFIVVFAYHATWAPEARWFGFRMLLLGGGMLAFWGLVLFRAHRVCRGESSSPAFVPPWLWIPAAAWTLGLFLWPH